MENNQDSGTKRDYANMLNEHKGSKGKGKKKGFSPWTKIGKKGKKDGDY